MSTESFGASWWGRKWIETLERLATAWQSRLPRGRDYANKGHVISLSVSGGRITARVQGSRSKPYTTTIDVPPIREKDWDRIIRRLAEESRFVAELLIGRMPDDIEDIFNRTHLNLFPMRNSEMLGSCTCPDKARPCKHIAAVHYAFGQALDRDPFLLFQLRGLDRDGLIRALHRVWFGDAATSGESFKRDDGKIKGEPVIPLSADRFNRSPNSIEQMSFSIHPSPQPLLILNRLDAPKSWQLPITIPHLLGPVYEEAAKRALTIALGENRDIDVTSDFDVVADPGDGLFGGGAVSKGDEFAALSVNDGPEPAPFAPPSTTSAPALFLPKSLGASPKRPEPEPEEDSAASSVMIRKGVATLNRRRKKNRTTGSLDPVSRLGRDDEETSPLRRRGKGRRRVLADAAPSQPPPEAASPEPVVRRRRVAAPAEPTLEPHVESEPPRQSQSAVEDDAPVVRRKRTRLKASTDTITMDRPKLDASADTLEMNARKALDEGDGATALDESLKAWKFGPTLPRLLLMLAAGDAAEKPERVVIEETGRLVARRRDHAHRLNEAELLLLLVSGRYIEAGEMLRELGEDAWDGCEGLGSVFIPAALMAACHDVVVPPESNLASLWEDLYDLGEKAFRTMENPPAPAGAWLEWALDDQPPSSDAVAAILEVAELSAAAMLTGKGLATSDKKAIKALRYAAAVMEALSLCGNDAQTRLMMGALRKEVSSSKRLSKAFDTVVSDSPILS